MGIGLYRHFPEDRPGAYRNDGVQDVQLAVSRDGVRWQRPERRPYIARGSEGSWDAGCIWPTLGMIRRGNEIWQYYCGTWHTHGHIEPGMKPSGGLCRLEQRLDGFVSADAGEQGGEIVTPLLTFTGTELELNVDCAAQGSVRVAILDEKEQPIPGYTLAAAEPVDRNQIAARVRWTTGKEIGSLQGRLVRLHFQTRSCKLYAFQFTDRENQ